MAELTRERVEAIQARHRRVLNRERVLICWSDKKRWPCEQAALCAALLAAWDERDRAIAQQESYKQALEIIMGDYRLHTRSGTCPMCVGGSALAGEKGNDE